ncbi:hypothetical protein GCM10010166_40830 [Couchioplanes caeruleus subsp. azureus]|nr:hypothetical protein GCM10010166_40830 [Couchioplanes caeruleus subsp. azureus]
MWIDKADIAATVVLGMVASPWRPGQITAAFIHYQRWENDVEDLKLDLEDLEVESLAFEGETDADLQSLGMGHGMTEVGASAGCCCCTCSCCCCPCG